MKKRNGTVPFDRSTVLLGVVIVALMAGATAGAQERRWNELNQKVNDLYNQGDLKGATAAAEEELHVAESTFSTDHPNYSTSLNNLAVLYQGQNRYADAESMFQRVLAIKEKLYGAEDARLLTTLNNLAGLFEAQNRYDQAVPYRKRALEIGEKAQGKEGVDLAQLLENLGALYYAQKRFGEAEPVFQRFLTLREKALGAESPDLVPALKHLVLTYKNENKLSAAESPSLRIISIDEKAYGKDSLQVAADLNNLGLQYQDEKRYSEADPLLLRSLQIQQKSTVATAEDVADAQESLAGLYLAEGKDQEAAKLYSDVSQKLEKTPDAYGDALPNALDGLASISEKNGNSGEAATLRQRAQQTRWQTMNVRVQQLGAEGKYAEALPVAEEELKLAEKTFGSDDLNVSRSLNNLSVVYRKLGRAAETEPLLLRASQIAEKNMAPDNPTLAKVFENLATTYFDDGKFADAEPFFRRALNIREKALPAGDPTLAASLNDLGLTYFQEGKYADAETVLRRLLQLKEKEEGTDSPDLSPLFEMLGTACQKQGKSDPATAMLERSRRIKTASAKPSGTIENDSTALLDADSYLRLLLPAARDAAAVLAEMKNPVFGTNKGFAVQSLTSTQPVSVTLLFPTSTQFPQYLSLIKSTGHSFCQVVPPVSPQDIYNLILCDPDTLRQLDLLIRVAYSPSDLDETMKNDWTFMRFLAALQLEPSKIMDVVKSPVSDEQMKKQMSLILVFLLAHETWHLTHGKGTNFDSGAGQDSPPDTELNEKLMCRNYESFLRQGFKLFDDQPVALAEEGTTDDPAFRQTLKATREIWQEEEDADRFGAETLGKLVYSMSKAGDQAEVYHSSSTIIQDFALMMLQIWFSKMETFAPSHCGGFAGQDFYLTQCTCQNKSIYRQVIDIFGSTHPPIVLRFYVAAASFLSSLKTNFGIDLAKSNDPVAKDARYWLLLIDGLNQVPLKLSWVQCSDFQKVRSQVGEIGQELPDLARFRMSGLNRDHPGYPTEQEELDLVGKCLASPTGTDAPPTDQTTKPN